MLTMGIYFPLKIGKKVTSRLSVLNLADGLHLTAIQEVHHDAQTSTKAPFFVLSRRLSKQYFHVRHVSTKAVFSCKSSIFMSSMQTSVKPVFSGIADIYKRH